MKDVLKNFSYIKDYIPVILAILTPILTYLIGVRKGNNEKFDLQLENNLKDVISPMLHEIKAITRQQEESNERNKLLKKFLKSMELVIANYTKCQTSIYVINIMKPRNIIINLCRIKIKIIGKIFGHIL